MILLKTEFAGGKGRDGSTKDSVRIGEMKMKMPFDILLMMQARVDPKSFSSGLCTRVNRMD
jgi:hypothetical protein